MKSLLGGNSKTSIIVSISPSKINSAETIDSLKFACWGKQIKNFPEIHDKSIRGSQINKQNRKSASFEKFHELFKLINLAFEIENQEKRETNISLILSQLEAPDFDAGLQEELKQHINKCNKLIAVNDNKRISGKNSNNIYQMDIEDDFISNLNNKCDHMDIEDDSISNNNTNNNNDTNNNNCNCNNFISSTNRNDNNKKILISSSKKSDHKRNLIDVNFNNNINQNNIKEEFSSQINNNNNAKRKYNKRHRSDLQWENLHLCASCISVFRKQEEIDNHLIMIALALLAANAIELLGKIQQSTNVGLLNLLFKN